MNAAASNVPEDGPKQLARLVAASVAHTMSERQPRLSLQRLVLLRCHQEEILFSVVAVICQMLHVSVVHVLFVSQL